MLNITMPRGDIHLARFQVFDQDTETVSQVDFDEIYFSVKANVYDRNVLFQKTLSGGGIIKLGVGDYQIKIEPADTEELDFDKKYSFDIELIYADQIKQTNYGELFLTREVTCRWNEANNNG